MGQYLEPEERNLLPRSLELFPEEAAETEQLVITLLAEAAAWVVRGAERVHQTAEAVAVAVALGVTAAMAVLLVRPTQEAEVAVMLLAVLDTALFNGGSKSWKTD
jgi:hypothetical protein